MRKTHWISRFCLFQYQQGNRTTLRPAATIPDLGWGLGTSSVFPKAADVLAEEGAGEGGEGSRGPIGFIFRDSGTFWLILQDFNTVRMTC